MLAWNRINTGANHQVKRYFRHLYASYSIALDANIQDLHERLRHGSYEPQQPVRVFLPKPSGLQRPLTLLSLEDQIVLQAIANLFANKLRNRRKAVEKRYVYSNILCKKNNDIFFLEDWHPYYEAFTGKILYLYRKGYHWIGEFDLAAFYETIAHDLLLKTAFPRGGLGQYHDRFLRWLKTWSAEKPNTSHGHGIPQGPIASDFLADCFLLHVDKEMGKRFCYMRYVDDVRIMGKSEQEVRRAAIELEILCRNRGLIPQAKKCELKKIGSADEIRRFLPSHASLEMNSDNKALPLNKKKVIVEFRRSLGGRPLRIVDKTRVRYVLYRSGGNPKLLRYVLALIPHHPEHIDAFVFYLNQLGFTSQIAATARRLIIESPYQYVRGEAWQILTAQTKKDDTAPFIQNAIRVIKNPNAGFSEKWGACVFLCAAERRDLGNYSKWALYLSPMIQGLLGPIIPVGKPRNREIVAQFMRRSDIEPGLSVAPRLVKEGIRLQDLGVKAKELPGPVRNACRALGLIKHSINKVEPIAELLQKSLGVPPWDGWRVLLGREYAYACTLLAQAVPVLKSSRSLWLIHQNSFNNLVIIAFISWLKKHNKPGSISLINKDGDMISYGVLLDKSNLFAREYPSIVAIMRGMNARRNTVPAAHPYSKNKARTTPLRPREQLQYIPELKTAFDDIAKTVKRTT